MVDTTSNNQTPNEAEVLAILATYKTTSGKIRALHQKGMLPARIAKTLDIRYQHVRNVLHTNLKRGPIEPPPDTD